jgi:hypothetical protein
MEVHGQPLNVIVVNEHFDWYNPNFEEFIMRTSIVQKIGTARITDPFVENPALLRYH